MTIRITIKNEDTDREIEVECTDPIDPAFGLSTAGGTVLGPQSQAEFWVHASQAVLVREVPQ